LARRYVHEDKSASVRRQLRTGHVATSRLSEVEVASALSRREREGGFSVAERDRGLRSLNRDLGAWIVVELNPQLTADAQALLVRHALRTGDAVQLASCLYLHRETGQRLQFAAFDDRLNTAAQAEGLTLITFT
jgi:predicted nucleic acid-binding protein